MHKFLDIRPDILEAMIANRPLVALESTIISHGMPYPENIKMAKAVETIVKEHGATPVTIAIMDGKIKIGLTDEELKLLATSKDVIKVSKRDFGYVLSQHKIGATTVSATMIACELAGISVFATGGIGGVHRGAPESFDISRDLEELANTNVCVVCAGAKSILDLGLTLEYLETKGVEVIGYQTEMLPAFYTNESPFKVDYQLNTPEEIAKLINTKWTLGLKGGVLITNPIPDQFSMNAKLINQTIDQAIKKANEAGIKGKEMTPYLLSEIKNATHGQSLDANLELVYHNAMLASQIAVAYANLKQ